MSYYDNVSDAYAKYVEWNYGDLTETEFARYYPRAAAYISTLTMHRSDSVTDEALVERVYLATFAVSEEMCMAASNDGAGAVISESNDGISVTYASSKDARTTERRQYDAAYPYLSGTGLLYRGVRGRC